MLDQGIGGFLRAMVGLRTEPPAGEGLVFTLVQNGWTEALAMGAWLVAWAVTGALFVVIGAATHSRGQPVTTRDLIISAIPMAISGAGVAIHVIKAGFAIRAGRKLARSRGTGGAYERVVARLTTPTPWILLPQVLIGVAFTVFVSTHVR